MYNLILIDDDTVALRHLSKLFEWENFDFTLSAIFTNGKAAMDYIAQNHVDLVITDIKMPAKNGLDLAKECLELYPDTHFILLSAYRDFSYAQKAISYNVIDYITKPFNIPDIEESIRKAQKKLSSLKKEPFVSKSTLAVQQNIFSHILCGAIKDKEQLKTELNKIGLSERIMDNNCAIITIKFKDFKNFLENSWKYGIQRLHNAISLIYGTDENVFSSLIKYDFDIVEFILINKKGDDNFEIALNKYLQEFKYNMKSIFNLDFSDVEINSFSTVTEAAKKSFASKSIIEKAKQYISEHYGENISLKDIASQVSLSPIYFSAFFKQHTNENFSDYLKKVRLEKALELLVNTDIPITSICTMVGYKNITYFYNLIKLQTGMTPNVYRTFHIQKR